MFQYLIRRLLWAMVLFIAVTFVTYVIFFLVPADPAALAAGKTATPEKIAEVEEFLGLDKPIHIQYAKFLKRLVVDQSLGFSFVNRQSVNDEILRAAPITASLVFGGMLLVILISIPIGVLSALRPRSLLDRAAMVYVLIGISLPSFWIGLVLSYLIGFKLGWTPIGGYCEVITVKEACELRRHRRLGVPHDPAVDDAFARRRRHLRPLRPRRGDGHAEPGLRAHRARQGRARERRHQVHVLRNGLLPVVTMLGMDIGLLLGGAIFIEAVFGLQGLGGTAYRAVGTFDLPVLQGVVIFSAVAIIVCTLIVDLLYAWIDPRIRLT